ncbi:MAG: NAD(+) diphosphatase [Victivallaceae bacterium]
MNGFSHSFDFHYNGESATVPLAVVFHGDNAELRSNSPVPEDAMFVGTLGRNAVVAFSDENISGKSLRNLQSELSHDLLMAVNRARQLINMRDRSRFCGRCGSRTEMAGGEPAFRCPRCGEMYFARLDPAIIVAVTRGDQLLLAHNSNFSKTMYSLVAGFIEGGETLEEAVCREVREEVGISVKNVRYFHSQFWPFRNSFMLGCFAEYDSGDITPDGSEIETAGFFSADSLPDIPGKGSVAHNIIEHWIRNGSKF